MAQIYPVFQRIKCLLLPRKFPWEANGRPLPRTFDGAADLLLVLVALVCGIGFRFPD